jgi:hypothetical protein
VLQLSVKADIKRVQRQLTRVQRREVPKAATHAINRAIRAANTQAARNISRESGIKPQRKVRERLRIIKASWTRLQAAVVARGRAINLVEFVTPSKKRVGAFRNKPGVVAKAWGQKKTYPGTFVGRGSNSSKPLVFVRKSAQRLPVRAVHGPSVPAEFQQRKVQEAMDDAALRTFRREFMRDLRRRLERLNRRR